MFCYSDPSWNFIEEHNLTPDEFENFLHRRGAFSKPCLPDGVSMVSELRLILQQNAQDAETFTPRVLSLRPEPYRRMIQAFHLSMRAIESTSCVGPFFWAAIDQDDENPHLQVAQRKSDVRKKAKTRGYELMLSYEFNTSITTGFCKGTPSSDVLESIKFLKACGPDICHPLLLPLMVFGHDASYKPDVNQRDARGWLRKLEHAISMRSEMMIAKAIF
ncbi:hypothetical protein EG329_014072 [Mollisiaceae sp. DMI_Dod_QoI]|nr:hypothetical protein EG329_014072 [Helotiales sp. DMI_Dod_QoI]